MRKNDRYPALFGDTTFLDSTYETHPLTDRGNKGDDRLISENGVIFMLQSIYLADLACTETVDRIERLW